MESINGDNFTNLLHSIILCSEKAACIARMLRTQPSHFNELVQEKESSNRSWIDLKTFADVLIQEVISFDLIGQFPGLAESIFGEENNSFLIPSGETVCIKLSNSTNELKSVFGKILGEQSTLVSDLTKLCLRPLSDFQDSHPFINLSCTELSSFIQTNLERSNLSEMLNTQQLSQLGIWIDPIDSTADYADGKPAECNRSRLLESKHSISQSSTQTGSNCCQLPILKSLANVTVLIGVIHKLSRQPIFGVVNHPFCSVPKVDPSKHPSPTNDHILWGLSLGDQDTSKLSNLHLDAKTHTSNSFDAYPNSSDGLQTWLVACSVMDSKLLKQSLSDSQNRGGSKVMLACTRGAGYKMGLVISGHLDASLMLGAYTYYWDTCAPHAILRALGGGVVRLKPFLTKIRSSFTEKMIPTENQRLQTIMGFLEELQICYDSQASSDISTYQNKEGFLAYRVPECAARIALQLANSSTIITSMGIVKQT